MKLINNKLEIDNKKIKPEVNFNNITGAIETIIFLSDRPIAIEKIRNIIGKTTPLRVIFEAIKKLQSKYQDIEHGINLIEVAHGFQFRTKSIYSSFIQDLFKVSSFALSPSTMETLAIVAYKQPVTRAEVDKIRGVDSSHLIRTLLDRRLVRIEGHSNSLGKHITYATTAEFLEVFNLKSITDLPSERELKSLAFDNSKKDIDFESIISQNKNKFIFDEEEELEQLSINIKNIKADTVFTKSIKNNDRNNDNNSAESLQTTQTAFDLLESFILNKEVSQNNKIAMLSKLMNKYSQPFVSNNELIKDRLRAVKLTSTNQYNNSIQNIHDDKNDDRNNDNLFLSQYKSSEFKTIQDNALEMEKMKKESLVAGDIKYDSEKLELAEKEIVETLIAAKDKAELHDITLTLD